MNSHVRIALLLLGTLLTSAGCTPRPQQQQFAGDGTVKVAVSFPALYCFAANVVGNTGVVKSVKSTQGAHGSEVTKADRELVESADLLFINGLGLDDGFAKNLQRTSGNKNLKVVQLGDQFAHKLLLESDGCECVGHDHEHGDHDPHVWMGPNQAIEMVKLMRRELIGRYPQHKATFEANAEAYTEKLKAMMAEGVNKISGKKAERKLVTVHGSMNYFANAFELTIAGVVQLTPGKEPSAAELSKLVETCVKGNVRVIAVEPQFSAGGAVKTLQEALKLKGISDPIVIELDPLETATHDELTPGWYEAKMRTNIAAISKVFTP
jgi:zinc transport system substrate-binding protein